MTLLHLRHDDVESHAFGRHLPFRHVLQWIGTGFAVLHRAIVDARLRRAENSLLYRRDYNNLFPFEQDAAEFPQRPLILGDKWDF